MTLVAIGLLAACSNPPATLNGTVVDHWGNPIEGATVIMEGQSERPLTDADGRYSFNLVPGKHTMRAGKNGFIQMVSDLEVKDGETPTGPVFKLHKKPEEPGYYLIGTHEYVKLASQPVKSIGNDLKSHRGLKSVGEALAEHDLQILFHTDLKYDQILRLGLELHKLKFVKEDQLPGSEQSKELVELNLYASDSEIPIEIEPIHSREDYLITPKESLSPGYYAFQTQDLLDSDNAETFSQIPAELRKVYSFEYR
jgi:hypothetical protein